MTVSFARQLEHALSRGDEILVNDALAHGQLRLDAPVTRYGLLPLNQAAWYGQTAMLELLVAHGAPLEGANEDGLTALLLAVQRGHWACAEKLLDLGASVFSMDGGRNQAMHFAAEHANGGPFLQRLVQRGSLLEHRNTLGWSALHVAAARGQTGVARTLLDLGADLHARDQEGHTPLLLAARERRIETLWALKEAGADPGLRNQMGEGLGDIVDPLLFEHLGRNHDVYWWLRPLMPVQRRRGPGTL
jgi:ankyrin repeat protein